MCMRHVPSEAKETPRHTTSPPPSPRRAEAASKPEGSAGSGGGGGAPGGSGGWPGGEGGEGGEGGADGGRIDAQMAQQVV